MVRDMGDTQKNALAQHILEAEIEIAMMMAPAPDHAAEFWKLIMQNLTNIKVGKARHYQLLANPQLDFDITTTEKVKASQRTQKPLATLEQVRLLTTQQAWETAKARGYSKSRDAFRAWSRRSPEKCRKLYGLIVITDLQRGKLIGYQDHQANKV